MNGKPLIAYSIETAKKCQAALAGKTTIALSTDSLEIRDVAAAWGLSTDYLRAAALATDTAGKIPVLIDIWKYEEKRTGTAFDYFLDLDVTSPLRTLSDIQQAFELMKAHPNALSAFSVSKPHRNPYFNMVELRPDGYAELSKKLQTELTTRQSAPKVFDMNASFYIYSRAFMLTEQRSAITERSLIYEVPHLCFDLDEPVDFDFLEYLLLHNKLTFEL